MMFHHSVDTCAVVVTALPDAHLGWSGPSSVNNKQASYRYTQLATMDIIAEYMEHVNFRQESAGVSEGTRIRNRWVGIGVYARVDIHARTCPSRMSTRFHAE